jgi:hypothetical protein
MSRHLISGDCTRKIAVRQWWVIVGIKLLSVFHNDQILAIEWKYASPEPPSGSITACDARSR